MRRINVLVSIAVLSLFLVVNPVGAITNGQPDGTRHPYVAMIEVEAPGYIYTGGNDQSIWFCTGTLIAPTVVLTAGHCLYGATSARVWFGGDALCGANLCGWPGWVGWIEAAAFYINPGFCHYFITPNCGATRTLLGFDTHDLALLILSSPVTDIGTLPSLPTYGMVSTLPMKSNLMVVGYGSTLIPPYGMQYQWVWDGSRKFASVQLIQSNDATSEEYMKLTGDPAQGKGHVGVGDSGGPVLYTDSTGDTYVLGEFSFWRGDPTGTWYANRIDTYALAWIQEYL